MLYRIKNLKDAFQINPYYYCLLNQVFPHLKTKTVDLLRVPAVTDLFADAAPGVVEDCVLITGNRGVQLLQHDLNAAAAVHEAPDVVHHGSLAEHAGALV